MPGCTHDMKALEIEKNDAGKLDITAECTKCKAKTVFIDCTITSHTCEWDDIPSGVEVKFIHPLPYPDISPIFFDLDKDILKGGK